MEGNLGVDVQDYGFEAMNELLVKTMEMKGSDLHLVTGSKPAMG